MTIATKFFAISPTNNDALEAYLSARYGYGRNDMSQSLEDLLWQNRTDNHIFVYCTPSADLAVCTSWLVNALVCTAKNGTETDCARSQFREFIIGCGGTYPVNTETWRKTIEGWPSPLDMDLNSLRGVFPRHIVVTRTVGQRQPVPMYHMLADQGPSDDFLLRRDGENTPFYRLHKTNSGPLPNSPLLTPEQQLAKVVEGLYDVLLGKPSGKPKDVLLAEYRKMTGKDMPGFMR